VGAAAYGFVLGFKISLQSSHEEIPTHIGSSEHAAPDTQMQNLYFGAEFRSEMTRPYWEDRARRSK
jgi:hypothetical protein